jgi:hypothetical protein
MKGRQDLGNHFRPLQGGDHISEHIASALRIRGLGIISEL